MEFPAGNTQASAVRNVRGRFQALQGDMYHGGLTALDPAHVMVHAGRYFSTTDIDQSVDIAAPKEWLFITPDIDDYEFHAKFGVYSSAGALFELRENAVVSANGSPLIPVNHHRTSAYESVVDVYADPTVTGDGERIEIAGVGSSGGAAKVGGELRSGSEWNLKPNTIYLLRATVLANGTTVALDCEHYEFDEEDLVYAESSSSA